MTTRCQCFIHVRGGNIELCHKDATHIYIQRRRAELIDFHYQILVCAEHAYYMRQNFPKTYFSMEHIEPVPALHGRERAAKRTTNKRTPGDNIT